MVYKIPHTDCEVHQLLPNTHISPETAYVVDDYPFGFRLRCKIRYWLEFVPRKGFRMCSQTTNPKKVVPVWNRPKCSTYCRFGGALFLDQHKHVRWHGIGEYSTTEECQEFVDNFFAAIPAAGAKVTMAWLKAKITYDQKKTKPMDATAAAAAAVAAAKEMQ